MLKKSEFEHQQGRSMFLVSAAYQDPIGMIKTYNFFCDERSLANVKSFINKLKEAILPVFDYEKV